ncbi:unnamed protein product [Bursaphelenchus xylophilus]|uniref:(pine wood nematode) hypothetical protein n=1 Tax=Bursaphelenchus xylophilus TaxID=6326 RepID=A0A1I7S063_BURXY|nr:unnamed protein product [Bursaphelenchus xylophilus]CAG9108988.1 unnamed protein product [Bursaphelenchus xylophilus]
MKVVGFVVKLFIVVGVLVRSANGASLSRQRRQFEINPVCGCKPFPRSIIFNPCGCPPFQICVAGQYCLGSGKR